MSTRRCSPCDINFPTFERYSECPACGGETWYDQQLQFDSDHKELVEQRREWFDNERKRAGNTAVDLASLYPHPPDARVKVHKRDGREFVFHRDLIEEGYLALEDFSIIFINNTFYELQGHGPGYRLVGTYHPDGVWWIEQIPLTLDTTEVL